MVLFSVKYPAARLKGVAVVRRRRRRQNRFQNASKRIVCVVVVDTSQSARLSREGRRREKKSRHRHHHHPENGGGGGGGGGGTKHPRRLSSSSSSSFPAAFAVVGRPQSCASFFFHYCVADTHKKIDFGQKCPHESLLRIHNASRKIEEEEKKIVLRFSLSLSLGRPRRSPLSRHTAPADSPLLMPFRRTLSPYFFSLGGRREKRSKKKQAKNRTKKKTKNYFFSIVFLFLFSLAHKTRDDIESKSFHQKHALDSKRSRNTHTHVNNTMGITFAKLFQRLFSKKEMRILMVRANFCAFFLMALSSEVANKERISTRRHIERHSRRR